MNIIDSKLKEAWEKRSVKYGSKIEGVLPKSFPKKVNKKLDEWMYSQVKAGIEDKNVKLLDLGCGYGRLALKIAKDFSNPIIDGIDISEKYVDLYNKKMLSRGKARASSIIKLPFKDETFDLVFMVTTLMYLTKPSEQDMAMKEIFRVLKTGGKFVFIERNRFGYSLVMLGGLVEKIRGGGSKEINSVSFTSSEIVRMVRKNGGLVNNKYGIPFWTISIHFAFILNNISQNALSILVRATSFFDSKFPNFLTPSMYISYTGTKK